MRPAVQYAIAFAVLVGGAGAWWAMSGPPPQEPVELLPLRPDGLPVAEEPIVGAMSDEERAALLDELEDFEAERYGASEASERRALREQMLRARTKGQPQTR